MCYIEGEGVREYRGSLLPTLSLLLLLLRAPKVSYLPAFEIDLRCFEGIIDCLYSFVIIRRIVK